MYMYACISYLFIYLVLVVNRSTFNYRKGCFINKNKTANNKSHGYHIILLSEILNEIEILVQITSVNEQLETNTSMF